LENCDQGKQVSRLKFSRELAVALVHKAVYDMMIFLVGIIASVIGVIAYASTTFDNATYMKEGTTIGPLFENKLLFVKAETVDVLCTFESGEDTRSIQVGASVAVGDYKVDLQECNNQQKFAVLHVRKKTLFYRVMNALWRFLHVR
jgi:hypothetical protein